MSFFFPLVSWALVAVQVAILALDPSSAFTWAMAAFTVGCAITTTLNA